MTRVRTALEGSRGFTLGGGRVSLTPTVKVGVRLVGTPSLALRTSAYGRDYRAGYRVGILEQGWLQFDLEVEAQRRENRTVGGAEGAFPARATIGW